MIKKITLFVLFLILSFVFAKISTDIYYSAETNLYMVRSDIAEIKKHPSSTQINKLQKLEDEKSQVELSLNTIVLFSIIVYIFFAILFFNFTGKTYDRITILIINLYNKHKNKFTLKNYLIFLATIAVICLATITYILIFTSKHHHRFFRF